MDQRVAPTDGVAAYATLRGACKAASHLVELGFDEHDVVIRPRQFHVAPTAHLREEVGAGARAGAAAGAAIALASALAIWASLDGRFWAVLCTAALGAVIGVVIGTARAIVHAREADRAGDGHGCPALAPERFEVVVDGDEHRAGHELARWWDVEAVPAGWPPTR
jgi:hypothetical protein